MLKFKRILSALMAVCLMFSVLPMVSLATDTSSLHNCEVPEGYHLFTDLPTEENPATTDDIYWGAAFDGVFHGMTGSGFSSGAIATSTDVAVQNKIAIVYGGVDETYGTYYYLTYTLPDGTAYTFAYSGGYFSQNKLTDGLPSGGWAAKHKLFYDAEQHIFYHRPSADMTVMKALKISASSFKFFTDTVAKVLADGTYPVRLYTTCTSDNVAGKNDTHQWSGSCKYDGCDTKFDYKERINIVDPDGYHQFDISKLPAKEGESVSNLYLGAAFEADGVFYGMSGTASSNAYPTSALLAEQSTITIHYGGNDATYGDYYYVEFTLASGVSYALAYASGYFSQNMIQDDGLPSGGWAAKHKMFFDTDYQFFYHRPSNDMTVMKGLKISAASQKLFTETVENLKVVSADYSPARLFEACTSDNVAGTDDIHIWTGACDCGYLFDYQVKPTPDSHHVYSGLPTAENPEITELSLGGNIGGVFYGLNAASAVGEDGNRYFTTAAAASEQCVITVRYAGTDTLYGDYYNVIFRIPGGDSYALAYAGGYFSQNKLTDGQPADGWQAKHEMFFDEEGQFFYYVIETDTEIVKKGLKLSATSQNIFTEKVENLKVENAAYVPVRLYEPCISDNVAGKGAAGRFSGICQICGFKFDLTADPNLSLPGGHHEFTSLPTADAPETTETLHLGIGLLTDDTATFYAMSGSFDAEHTATTSTDAVKQYTFRILYGGNDATYGDYYYVIYNNLDGTEYAFAYAAGYLSQNKILENGEPTDGWQYKHRLYFDQDGQFFYHRPSADMTVMKGIKISTSSYNLFTEKVEVLKADNEIYPVRLYVVCTSDNVAGKNDTHHWSGACSCGYLFDYEENYVVETRAPQADTAYYWGVTQLDKEGTPTYFFNGEKLTSTFNTQTDMLTGTEVYVDVVEGGYQLYFLNENSEKQYICLGKDAANEYATFIAIETDAANATVYIWNAEYSTFVATVVANAEGETLDMVLGAYTSGGTAYTKLTALTLAHLAQEHYFASHLYVEHITHEYAASWSYDAQSHWKACFCGSKAELSDHNFTAWHMILNNSGIMSRSCDCGYVQEVQESSEMPSFMGVSLSLHSSFAINFYVKTESFVTGGYQDPYMVFEMLGEQTVVTESVAKNDCYVFTFDNVAPDLMDETIKATLYATAEDGSEFALSTEYTLAQYCYTVLRMADTNAELRKLIVETLNFAAVSQQYRNSDIAAEDLVNADLTDEERALGAAGELRALESCRDFGVNTGEIRWYGVSALLGDSVKMRVYFIAEDVSDLTIQAVSESGTWTLTADDMKSKDDMYYVDFGQLNPAQMSQMVSFTVYRGETAVSSTLNYSIESYAAVWVNKANAKAEQVELVKAIIRYGDAAKAYTALDKRTVTEEVQLAEGVTKYAVTYDIYGVRTKAYAVVVDADSSAKVMTVAAPWDETNNDENPVTLYSVYEYRSQLENQGHDVLAITNGGFFHMSAGSNLPWGMQIIDGVVIQEPSKDSLAYSDNWFGVTTDGQYVISNTEGYNNTYKGNIQYGIGGGKLLMKDGVEQAVSGSDSYRTCVGITENGDLIILCLETCTYEMAVRAFTDLNMGVKTILNLDGGGSTTLYTGDVRWQIGYDICGDGLFPRDIADAIAIVSG